MATASGAFQFSEPGLEHKSYPAYLSGFDPYERTVERRYGVGDSAVGQDGTLWRYGKATAAVALALPALPAFGVPMAAVTPVTPAACAISTTGDISGGAGFVAYAPFAIGEYGWVKSTTLVI